MGSAGDAHESAAVEPVKLATLAAADDCAASSHVEVNVHLLMAIGALDLAFQIFRIRRGWNLRVDDLGTQLIDDGLKNAHVDESAVAAITGIHLYTGDHGVPQLYGARRAIEVGGGFVNELDAGVIGGENDDRFAIVAVQAGIACRQVHDSAT